MTKTKPLRNLETKKNLIPILKAISKMNVTDYCYCLDNLNDSSVDGICECVYNIIFNDLKLSLRKRNALKNILKLNVQLKTSKK
jgi:hypothetical protein